jgi:hypothetical protein
MPHNAINETVFIKHAKKYVT